MKRELVMALALIAAVAVTGIARAGDLDPPGPPMSTMKDLVDVEPRIPLRNLFTLTPVAITQSGSYYLAENIFALPNAHGVEITTDDVSLDLRGFTIYGNTGVGSLDGVHVTGSRYNISISNGSVRDFVGDGVDGIDMLNSRIENLRVYANQGDGIKAGTATIASSVAEVNLGNGFVARHGSVIVHCVARGNTQAGYNLTSAAMHDSTAYANSNWGIVAADSLIRGGLCLDNLSGAIDATGGLVVDTYAP
jgi:hypothetical protein